MQADRTWRSVTAQDVETAVKTHKIKRYNVSECSYCRFMCHFIFDHEKNMVFYNPGCKCMYGSLIPQSYENVSNNLNSLFVENYSRCYSNAAFQREIQYARNLFQLWD